MTNIPYREPVSSLEELLDSDLKIAVAANSSIEEYFSGAASHSIQAQIWKSKLQGTNGLLKDTAVFADKLANGEVPDTVLFGVFQSIREVVTKMRNQAF